MEKGTEAISFLELRTEQAEIRLKLRESITARIQTLIPI
jgi:hypothetical protein